MQKFNKIVVLFFMIMGLMSSIMTVSAASLNVSLNITPVEDTGLSGRANWDQGIIEAVGRGVPPENVTTAAQANLLARRAAVVDAQRNLAETIQGVQVDSETTMQSLAIISDIVNTKVSALVRNARIVREKKMPDGSYMIVMVVNLHGPSSVASVALNAVKPTEILEIPKPITEVTVQDPSVMQASTYTGIIIDARGLDVSPTFLPRVYDETGRMIYGNMYIDVDFAISQGMIEYTTSEEILQAPSQGHSRAGLYALVVKGVKAQDNNFNMVISNADADKILNANLVSNFLKKCAVVCVR